MRVLLPLFMIAAVAAAPAAPIERTAATPASDPYPIAKGCPETPMSLARKSAEKPRLRTLGELPPAHIFRAVDHRVGGCAAPVRLGAKRRR